MISQSIIFLSFCLATNLTKKQSILQSEPGPFKNWSKYLLNLTKTTDNGASLKDNELFRGSPCFKTPSVKF